MKLPGLATLSPNQEREIKQLANMIGESFMEELWTIELLSVLDKIDTSKKRKLSISQAMIYYNLKTTTQFQTSYMLGDAEAGAGAYLKSELLGASWPELEDAAFKLMAQEFLTPEEHTLLKEKLVEIETVSDFGWFASREKDTDFIHLFDIGVNSSARGTGAFRRLITPFTDFADEQGIDCCLECYSERLVGLYGHFGFEIVEELRDPKIKLVQYCMIRPPEKTEMR